MYKEFIPAQLRDDDATQCLVLATRPRDTCLPDVPMFFFAVPVADPQALIAHRNCDILFAKVFAGFNLHFSTKGPSRFNDAGANLYEERELGGPDAELIRERMESCIHSMNIHRWFTDSRPIYTPQVDFHWYTTSWPLPEMTGYDEAKMRMSQADTAQFVNTGQHLQPYNLNSSFW